MARAPLRQRAESRPVDLDSDIERPRRRAAHPYLRAIQGTAASDGKNRRSLRHTLVAAGQHLGGRARFRGDEARRPQARGNARDGAWRARLHHQPQLRRLSARRKHAGRYAQRGADLAGARVAAAAVRSALVFLEERQVAAGLRIHGRRSPRLLGTVWLPHARRSLARRALRLAVSENSYTATTFLLPPA